MIPRRLLYIPRVCAVWLTDEPSLSVFTVGRWKVWRIGRIEVSIYQR